MCAMIKTEFIKLKRYSILLIGLLGMVCSPFLQLFSQMIMTEEAKNHHFDFAALVEDTLWGNATIFLPVILTLVGGYIINREYTDDTLKNILAVPLSFRKFLMGKLATIGLLALCFGVSGFGMTVLVGVCAGLGGMTGAVFLRALLQMAALAVCIYVIVLPVITICSRRQGLFMGGAVVSFLFGYCSMFFKSGLLRDLYPFLAGLTLIGFDSRSWINSDEPGSLPLGILVMGGMALLSAVLLLAARPADGRKNVRSGKKKTGRRRR